MEILPLIDQIWQNNSKIALIKHKTIYETDWKPSNWKKICFQKKFKSKGFDKDFEFSFCKLQFMFLRFQFANLPLGSIFCSFNILKVTIFAKKMNILVFFMFSRISQSREIQKVRDFRNPIRGPRIGHYTSKFTLLMGVIDFWVC